MQGMIPMNENTDAPDAEGTVNGVRIAGGDPDAMDVMARMVRARPDVLCQTMVALRLVGGGYAVEMEDGLDRAELTQPIADGLAGALGGLGLRHGGISVGESSRIDPS